MSKDLTVSWDEIESNKIECPECNSEENQAPGNNGRVGDFGELTCQDCDSRFKWECVPNYISTKIQKN